MTPDLQHQIVLLLGALTLGVPLAAPHVPKWIDALTRMLERWIKARADAIKAKADAAVLVEKAKAEAHKAEADAKRTTAETDKLEAETAAAAMADFRNRLDGCERKHAEAEHEIQALKRQSASDTFLLEKLTAEMEQRDRIISGLRKEMDGLRRAVQSGGGRHA